MCLATMTRKQIVLLGLLLLIILGSKPVYAMPASCFTEYAQFTQQAWGVYEQCIQDTNNDAWYAKIGIRQVCRIAWVSDALQAEGAYVSCMANFSALWK